jgi:hypothetical protein
MAHSYEAGGLGADDPSPFPQLQHGQDIHPHGEYHPGAVGMEAPTWLEDIGGRPRCAPHSAGVASNGSLHRAPAPSSAARATRPTRLDAQQRALAAADPTGVAGRCR